MSEAIGLGAAVTSALTWATSIVWFQAALERFGPGSCNLFKAVLGALVFAVVLAARLATRSVELPSAGVAAALALSGFIGFALGDLAFFAAMRLVGARLGSVLQSTYPLFLLGFSLADGGTRLLPIEAVGVLLVVAGVIEVSSRQGRILRRTGRVLGLGIAAGLTAALGQATGLLITDGVMDRIDVLTASAIRLGGAAAGLLAFYAAGGKARFVGRLMLDRTFLRLATGPVLLGSVVSIAAMTLAIDLARPAPAGALMSLTPIFLVPLTTLMRGEPYDPRVLIGTAVAVGCVITLVCAQAR